ncbi:myosin [Acrasis kona]|uniref:Myosin n=1 Tax=Acrasis kona TaxID=1008807 RepID=A0AAW2ZGB7_9EUKA
MLNAPVVYKGNVDQLTPISMIKYTKTNRGKMVQVVIPDSPDPFSGQKLRRRASFDQQSRMNTDNGKHDYMRMQFSDLMDQLHHENGDFKVYFSAVMRQYSTSDDRLNRRDVMILITDRAFYIVDQHGYLILKTIPFVEIQSVSLSTLPDGFVIFHAIQFDIVLESALKTILVKITSQRVKLKFRVSDEINVRIKNVSGSKILHFIETRRRLPIKTFHDAVTPALTVGTPDYRGTEDHDQGLAAVRTETQVIRTELGADILVRINRSDLLLQSGTPTPMRSRVMDVYRGEKLRRRASLLKWYAGDYLRLNQHESFIRKLPSDDCNVLFSATVDKVDHNLRIRERKLIVTEKNIYLCSADMKIKRTIELTSVMSIGVSTFRDGFLVLNLDSHSDYLINSPLDKTELIKIIIEQQKRVLNSQALAGRDMIRNSDMDSGGVKPEHDLSVIIGLELVVENRLYYCPAAKKKQMEHANGNAISVNPFGQITFKQEDDTTMDSSDNVTPASTATHTNNDLTVKRRTASFTNVSVDESRTVEFQEDNTQEVLATLHRTLTGILIKVNNDLVDSADLRLSQRSTVDIYNGRKARRRASISREHIGDYSGTGTDASRNKTKIMNKNKDAIIYYCSSSTNEHLHKLTVNKVTEQVVKGKDLMLLITDAHLYRIDPKSDYKIEKKVPIHLIRAVSVSTLQDNVVCLHIKDDDNNAAQQIIKDMLLECEKKTELIEQIYAAVNNKNRQLGGKPLQINVCDEFAYRAEIDKNNQQEQRKVNFVMDHASRETRFEYIAPTNRITVHVHYEQPHLVLEESFVFVKNQQRPIPIGTEPVTIQMGKNWEYNVEIRFFVNNRALIGYKFYEKIDTTSKRKQYVSDVSTLQPRGDRYSISMPERKVQRSLLSKTRVKCKMVDPVGRTIFVLRFVYEVKSGL